MTREELIAKIQDIEWDDFEAKEERHFRAKRAPAGAERKESDSAALRLRYPTTPQWGPYKKMTAGLRPLLVFSRPDGIKQA